MVLMRRPMAPSPQEARREADWIRRAKEGNREAFDQLVRAHFARVYSLLFRLVGNHEDAEDLAQECFVRAWKALSWYRAEAAFATWLHRIAVHLARDRGRQRTSRGETLALEATELSSGAEPEPGRELSRKELSGALARAVERLPERLRSPFVLRVLEGLEYESVAELTGVRPGTVRTQVMQARRLLLRWMEPWLERISR